MEFNFDVRMLLRPDSEGMTIIDAAHGRVINGQLLKGAGNTQHSNSIFN
jgi:hypothetical protein